MRGCSTRRKVCEQESEMRGERSHGGREDCALCESAPGLGGGRVRPAEKSPQLWVTTCGEVELVVVVRLRGKQRD
jgi:hypothetical protein